MKNDEWRGQMRAPMDVIEWMKGRARERFTSMNSIMVEALREYKEKRTSQQEAKQ